MPATVVDAARSVAGLPLPERIKAISEPWIGLPYENGPLGELGGLDPDPVTRYDTFDCLTFVEEVLALALSPDPEAAQQVRRGLRYVDGGPATYENRRHFMLAEWIPGNVEDGWVVDITSELPGALREHKVVTAETWSSWRQRPSFELADERLPTGELDFWYLPLDAALAAVDEIPPGSLIVTLRQPYDHLPIAVTHVGITVPAEVPTMRHASRMGQRVVRDDALSWYIEHLRSYEKWPAAGLIVLAPVEYGPRR